MSLDSGNLLGCYTELEIAAGIPSLVDGRSNGYLDDLDEEVLEAIEISARNESIKKEVDFLTEFYNKEKRKKLSEKIAGIERSVDVMSVAIQELIIDNLDYTILRFGRKENIPESYLKFIKQKDIIQSMIKGFFSKQLNVYLTSDLVEEIEYLVSQLQINYELDTPYNRVARLQEYIHNKARFIFGLEGHKKLPRKQMGIILSCARMNLSIFDLERSKGKMIPIELVFKNVSEVPEVYFGFIFFKCLMQSKIESLYPKVIEPIDGEYKPSWNIRFMKPISYYGEEGTRNKIQEIISLDAEKPVMEIKRSCVDIYSR